MTQQINKTSSKHDLLRAVFFSKDGTLVSHAPQIRRAEKSSTEDQRPLRFLPGVIKGLSILHAAGFSIFVTTNQPDIAQGTMPESSMATTERRMRELMARVGVPLSGFAYCPHHPHGKIPHYSRECLCRKPSPGLILETARTHNIDLGSSWVIGDRLNDVEAAHRAGCRAVIIDNGNETDWSLAWHRKPDLMAADLVEAALMVRSISLTRPAHGAIA